MTPKTKGQLEAEISEAIVRFEREYMGRGPEETKTYLLDDLIVVRLKGVLTAAEEQLARSDGDVRRGRALVKEMRSELIERARPLLDAVVLDMTGRKVVSLHTDISIVTGERVIVFTLESVPRVPGNDRDES